MFCKIKLILSTFFIVRRASFALFLLEPMQECRGLDGLQIVSVVLGHPQKVVGQQRGRHDGQHGAPRGEGAQGVREGAERRCGEEGSESNFRHG